MRQKCRPDAFAPKGGTKPKQPSQVVQKALEVFRIEVKEKLSELVQKHSRQAKKNQGRQR